MAEAGGFDYFLVLDFEATCDDRNAPKPQEIIEFPVLKVNARTFQTESTFHTYVLPTEHPVLTTFCTELTGITQGMIRGKPSLSETLQSFHEWLKTNNLLDPGVSFCFVTCGDWDLKTMLPGQCKYLGIPVPNYFHRWINIKQVFRNVTGHKATGMPGMLRHLGLSLDGRHHSGIDDSKNIAKILIKLVKMSPSNIQPTTILRTYSLKKF